MKNLKKIALIALISTAMTSNAFAEGNVSKSNSKQHSEQQSKHHKGKHQGKHKKSKQAKKSHMGSLMRYYRHADINKEQRQKIKQIFKDSKQAIKPNRQKTKQLKTKLRMLSQVKNYDQNTVSNIAKEISATHKNTIEIMHKAKYQAWQVLTTEQQKKLQEFDKKRKEKRKNKKTSQ